MIYTDFGYSQRINKAGEEIPEAPGQHWPQLCSSPCGQRWTRTVESWLPLCHTLRNPKRKTEGMKNDGICGQQALTTGLGMIWYFWGTWGAEPPKRASGLDCAEGGKWIFHFSQTCFHRITEWFGFSRTLKIILFHLLPWIGTPSTRPDSKVPSNLKLISSRDGASTPSLSSLFHCPDCKEFLFNIKSKSAFLQFENIWYILCAFYTVCPQNSAVPSAEAHQCIRGSETSPFAVWAFTIILSPALGWKSGPVVVNYQQCLWKLERL